MPNRRRRRCKLKVKKKDTNIEIIEVEPVMMA